jgi:hypothetical protein
MLIRQQTPRNPKEEACDEGYPGKKEKRKHDKEMAKISINLSAQIHPHGPHSPSETPPPRIGITLLSADRCSIL